MKKYLLIVALGLVFVTPVLARHGDNESEVEVEMHNSVVPTVTQLRKERAEAKAEFRETLKKLKDVRKQAIVEKVNTRMCEVQKKRVATMTTNLGRMTEVLVKVSTKSETLSTDKKTTVLTAINAARTAIESAKSAVTELEAKKCDLTLSGTDSAVKSEVTAARLAFEASVRATQEKVVMARKATEQAVRALAVALGEKI